MLFRSGGGTQTFIASAIDPRITVSIPCVMVSTAMQGGCTCENASLLRIGTGNVEIAALFAPKPLGMSAANDWTKEIETKGFPELQQLYKQMGAPENVALWPQLQFGHNYNSPTREHIYAWFNKHFALGLPQPIVERDYKLLSREQLTVWDAAHPAPEGGLEFEKKLLRWWDEDSRKQIAAKPEILRAALPILIGRPESAPSPVTRTMIHTPSNGTCVVLLSDSGISVLEKKGGVSKVEMQILEQNSLISAADKFALRTDAKMPELPALREKGVTIIGIDLLGQKGASAIGATIEQQPIVKNPREALSYTLGYNGPLFAKRVQDVIAVVKPRPHLGGEIKRIILVATGHTGPIAAAAAAALASDAVDGIAIEATDEHPFAKITDWRDPNLLPGAVKYGDLAALIKLIAPRPVILFKTDAERAAAIEKLVGAAK